MAVLQITLDNESSESAQTQALAAGFGTVDDYIRALIRADERRRDAAALDRKLIDSLDDGEAAEMTESDWEHVRSEVHNRLAGGTGR